MFSGWSPFSNTTLLTRTLGWSQQNLLTSDNCTCPDLTSALMLTWNVKSRIPQTMTSLPKKPCTQSPFIKTFKNLTIKYWKNHILPVAFGTYVLICQIFLYFYYSSNSSYWISGDNSNNYLYLKLVNLN